MQVAAQAAVGIHAAGTPGAQQPEIRGVDREIEIELRSEPPIECDVRRAELYPHVVEQPCSVAACDVGMAFGALALDLAAQGSSLHVQFVVGTDANPGP